MFVYHSKLFTVSCMPFINSISPLPVSRPWNLENMFIAISFFYSVRKRTTSVADPNPGSGAFLTPGSGMGRKSASGSGMNNPDNIFWSLETISLVFLGLNYLNSLMRIRDGDSSDPGWKKSRIRDKHPGSATLRTTFVTVRKTNLLVVVEWTWQDLAAYVWNNFNSEI
jgi:hypothetical protein